jgi:hypothetical protein
MKHGFCAGALGVLYHTVYGGPHAVMRWIACSVAAGLGPGGPGGAFVGWRS